MSGKLRSLLRRYEQGKERVDVAKLRVLLQQTSAVDKWDIILAREGSASEQITRLLEGMSSTPAVLHNAVHYNDVETVRCMLEGFQLDQICDLMTLKEDYVKRDTALYIAACNGSVDMVKFILDSMQDRKIELLIWNRHRDGPLHEGESVLHIAASKGHTNIVRYILESVPNKLLDLLKLQDSKGNTVLQAAVDANDMEMVQCILSVLSEDQRYEVLKQQAVLHAAASKGHTNILQSILESVPNKTLDLLKLRYGRGRDTLLHTAAIEKKSETVLTILQSVTQEGLKDLQNIKNNQNQSIADLAAPELYYLYTAQELAALKKSSEEKDTVIARQAKEIDDNRQKLAAVERQLRDDLAKQTEDNAEQIKQVQLEKQQQDNELAMLKGSSEQKDTVIAAQAEELRSTRQEVTELRESYVQQETVITSQAEELQQLRHNQTEMLRMVEALEISMGRPTSDQENETDSDN